MSAQQKRRIIGSALFGLVGGILFGASTYLQHLWVLNFVKATSDQIAQYPWWWTIPTAFLTYTLVFGFTAYVFADYETDGLLVNGIPVPQETVDI